MSTTIIKLSRSEQSRINGAKSRGPKTPAGKLISSRNALTHGFSAVINIVLRIEDKPAYEAHLAALHASYQPRDYAEIGFVDQLGSISWRQSRLAGLETALFDAQIDQQYDAVAAAHPGSPNDPYLHLVKAWQAISCRTETSPTAAEAPELPETHSLDLLRRYQNSLAREYRTTLLSLISYRKNFAAPPNSSHENEPEKPQIADIEVGERAPEPRSTRNPGPTPCLTSNEGPSLKPGTAPQSAAIDHQADPPAGGQS